MVRRSRVPIFIAVALLGAVVAIIVLLSVRKNFYKPIPPPPPETNQQSLPAPIQLDTREGVVTLTIPGGFGLQREDGQEVFIQVDEETSFTKSGSNKTPIVFTNKDIKVGDRVSVVSVPDQNGWKALTIVWLP